MKNKHIYAVLVLVVIVFAGVLFSFIGKEKNTDPLMDILGTEGNGENYKADFFGVEGVDFKAFGEVSGETKRKKDALTRNMAKIITKEVVKQNQKYDFKAYYNPGVTDYGMTRAEIIKELNPIFGRAIRNNSINWVYNPGDFSYTFVVMSVDADLWKAYFLQNYENYFFNQFFHGFDFPDMDSAEWTIIDTFNKYQYRIMDDNLIDRLIEDALINIGYEEEIKKYRLENGINENYNTDKLSEILIGGPDDILNASGEIKIDPLAGMFIGMCDDDIIICPNGNEVVRDPYNNCEFYSCDEISINYDIDDAADVDDIIYIKN